jgi:hypothetical protein
MSNFECNKCFRIFKTKQQLQRHLESKNRCDIVTEHQCSSCLKYFKSKHTLTEHKSCKSFNIEKINELKINELKTTEISHEITKIEKGINDIINSDLTIEQKISYIKKYNLKDKLTDDELKELILLNKIPYICSLVESSPNIINNTINNNIGTINNIQINNFGNENQDYLDQEYFSKLLNKNDFEKVYLTLTKDIYLRLDHPENRTIKVENINNKYAYVYERDKWRGILKSELKEILYKKNKKLIRVQLETLKDIIDETNSNSIKLYLARNIDVDPVMKDLNEKMILLFYTGKDKTII